MSVRPNSGNAMLISTQDNIELLNTCPSESKIRMCINEKENTPHDSIVYTDNHMDTKINRSRKHGVKLGMH